MDSTFWQMHRLFQPTAPLWMPDLFYFPLDPSFASSPSVDSCLFPATATSQLSFQCIDMALVLLKVRQQIFVHCPLLQPALERSKYKSGADPAGCVLQWMREQLRSKELQGTSRHWHLHGKDTSSGFAEILVNTELQSKKKSWGKSDFF